MIVGSHMYSSLHRFFDLVNAMKFTVGIAFIAVLSGCTSMDTLVAQKSIRIGMTKTAVASVALAEATVDDDPWLGGCFYEYVRERNCEILSGSARNQFLVFCGAYSESSCGNRYGNSTLVGIYRTYTEAKRSITPQPQPTYKPAAQTVSPRPVSATPPEDKRANEAKIQRCAKRGLSPGTPAFKKCFAEQ
jgi:hypothetical protein